MEIRRPMRVGRLSIASVAIAAWWSGTAFGQGLQPAQRSLSRPTVSPYVNLGNTSRNGGLNYFGQVRPQQQFRSFGTGVQNQLQQMQTQLGAPQSVIDDTGRQPTSMTGHSTSFLNTSGTFQNTSGYFGGSGSAGAQGGSGSYRPRPSQGASRGTGMAGAGARGGGSAGRRR